MQSAYNGRGDCADPSTWPEIAGPSTINITRLQTYKRMAFGPDQRTLLGSCARPVLGLGSFLSLSLTHNLGAGLIRKSGWIPSADLMLQNSTDQSIVRAMLNGGQVGGLQGLNPVILGSIRNIAELQSWSRGKQEMKLFQSGTVANRKSPVLHQVQGEAVLFEGWMLGFKPLPDDVVKTIDPQLEVVNKNLQVYYDAWDKFVRSWIVVKIKGPSCVYQWRLQAGQAMRADGKPSMSDDEILDFVSCYMPAYKAYLPTLYSEGPNGSDPSRTLVIKIDEGRNPILTN
ncbi:hypothetical protein Cgig2_014212 [Carnegiea gigantea]|uniref:Uncharacterized protein n=1 Tax=Carnegiea gigantea TaxID=171969 RepID=A0A9Q1GWN4_9CARY|nr:hypothetical protein Cgig2_014212 [Carnegiea gigantea]